MAVTVKMFWLAASNLLVLQLADCSPLGTKNNDASVNNANAINAGVRNALVKEQIKGALGTGVLLGNTAAKKIYHTTTPTIKKVGSIVNTAALATIRFPGYLINETVDVVGQINQQSKSKTESEPNSCNFKRAISKPIAAVHVGKKILGNRKDYLKQSFNDNYEHNDNTTHDDTVTKPLNFGRVLSNPIALVKTVTDVTSDGLKDAAHTVINSHRGNKNDPKLKTNEEDTEN